MELLTVIAIIGLLLGILAPALSTARQHGTRAKCLGLLKGLAGAGAAYSVDDSRNQLLPVHPIADSNADHDEGFFDFGGATGSGDVFGGMKYGPNSPRTAATRPLNRQLYGQVGGSDDYAAFQCPSDTGYPPAPHHDPDWVQWDDAMTRQSIFKCVGTSYLANAGRTPAFLAQGGTRASFTPFLRPANRVPLPQQTVLFCEAGFWLALFNLNGVFNPFPSVRLNGWHGSKPSFNVSMADGHAVTIQLLGDGGFGGQPDVPPEEAPAMRALWLGQPGWQLHCRPDELIPDLPLPTPAPGPAAEHP